MQESRDLLYSVKVKCSWHEFVDLHHQLCQWCTQHVGEEHINWSSTIAHMDFEGKFYTLKFQFDSTESAGQFALVFA